ncbi:MAG: hypothetical protein R3C11_19080 [Planctomycetaceae bacterium]
MIESIGDRVLHPLPIASVKVNIGHSLETAGLSSLIKTILGCRTKPYLPLSTVKRSLQNEMGSDPPFVVQQSAEHWGEQPDGSPRMASVDTSGLVV